MSLLSCILWSVGAFASLMACERLLIPRLCTRADGGGAHRMELTAMAWLGACTVLAVLCGWFAAATASNWVSNLRLMLAYCTVACAARTDWETRLIPNELIAASVCARVLTMIPEAVLFPENLAAQAASSAVGLLVCFFGLLLVSLLTHGGIGYGDVKLFGALGFLCGLYGAVSVLIGSCLLCSVCAFVLILLKKKGKKDAVAMGPFVFAGYVVMMLLGAY